MKKIFLTNCLLLAIVFNGCTQNKRVRGNVGGACEGCEAIYECPRPFNQLKDTTYLPDWNDDSTGIAISGKVYKADGKTPAAGVIIYVYHTDQTGVYPIRGNEKGWDRRHGYIRGWMKTNAEGGYKFWTRIPAPYPGRKDPAHIHITIKEPDKNEYWIDEYLFDEDPLLTTEFRNQQEQRGGSGILTKKLVRDIILGKNIPNYPK